MFPRTGIVDPTAGKGAIGQHPRPFNGIDLEPVTLPTVIRVENHPAELVWMGEGGKGAAAMA